MNLEVETDKRETRYKPKIGLALGSGIARAWSHIGIIRALEKHNIKPDVIVGSSGGAIIGGLYAAGYLNEIEDWAYNLSKYKMLRYFDLKFLGNGFLKGDKLIEELKSYVGDVCIEDLKVTFAAIATDLETGHEVTLKQGNLSEVIRASFSLPVIFQPFNYRQRWLVDGALVNPVPVSTCYALGADVVIAVNLNGDMLGKVNVDQLEKSGGEHSKFGYLSTDDSDDEEANIHPSFFDKLLKRKKDKTPSLFESIWATVLITQDRITRSRLAGEPPDIHLTPYVGHIGVGSFHRAKELVESGHSCVEENITDITNIINLSKAKFYK